jgi:hypothetical protein
MGANTTILRRYTQFPALIYLLQSRRLTLLDPKSWDDKNDSYYLSIYRRRQALKSVLALCFSEEGETYHHWSVFAPGTGGICIEFDREALLRAVSRRAGVRGGSVSYWTLKESRERPLLVSDLPFRKRYAYQPEREFRLLYESKREELQSLDVPIPLKAISRVYLSPWLPMALQDAVKALLHSIQGCRNLKVYRSTLISNESWKRLADEAVGRVR